MTIAARRRRTESATVGESILAFQRLRRRLIVNHLRTLLRGSRLRIFMILFCSAVFWAGLFGLFLEAFVFLDSFVDLYNDIIRYVFSIFFLSLLVMLIFSTGIIVYTGLFQSREAAFLLTTPAATDRIFAYKFVEAVGFSSWGFLLLGSPMMAAYGLVVKADWPFYPLCLLYLGAFVLIPGSLGAVGAILMANFFPRRRKSVLLLGAIVLAVLAAALTLQVVKTPGDAMAPDWINGLMARLAFSQNPLLPSLWMSKGLIRAAQGNWREGAFYLMVTAAHALLAYLVAAVVARDLYRQGYSRVQGDRSARRVSPWYGLDNLFHRVFYFLPRPIRLLILKDVRTFRRDPAQFSQFLIFFGLLTIYFLNIPRIGSGDKLQDPYWRHMLSFLNLAVTALLLSTFTTRFIFPLLSLEGRNFWVLGLFPLKREAILWGKFAFAAGISLAATEALVVLSDWMLGMGWSMVALHVGMVAILCLGLSAISVGLGARLPNLKEEDPSKIATGFGGTLNLVVSLVFILIVVGAMALPAQIYFAGRETILPGMPTGMTYNQFRFWMGVSIVLSVVVGAIATIVPLRIGIKAFQRMDF